MARIPKPHINKPQIETFHKGHATSWLWYALPSGLTMVYSMVAAGSITGLVWYIGDTYGNGQGSNWMYIAIGVMTLLGLIGLIFNARRNKKKAAVAGSFEEAVKGSAAGWGDAGPTGNDPAEIARLDNLRKQFQKGIDAFKDYGKDFYSLPWYVMVGEPGSGKTEAIRHSDLRFPETLQDMLQGTGGTYSMDWWFTNQAVLLDTAGAMLMNPEATKRFEEFLKLLRTYRPDCPVNGLILAIPVDSLLADNAAKLEEKAKRIAQQFTIIQKALDVRFPIYLMVTKSDRLPGFREFTDAAGQQTFDREMLGWSNPADLDTPFDPAHIGGALNCIADRIKARRLALMADPIPRQAGSRRVDEVDSLFGFPETILSLQPRLQRYLEVIFQTGTWATLPPFFRGVYFTSAMNEGAALDEQLASALGMSIETLPGGGLFNRDKSVYLRDVFTEKIFKERGLVTRLKDIGRALRRKLVWFYATTAILLLLLLGLAWLVKRNVEKELELETENWRVANSTWGNGAFLPIVTRMESPDSPDGTKNRPRWIAAWQGENARVWKKLGDSAKDNLTKIQFLDYLQQRTERGVPGAGIFRIMPSIRDSECRRRVASMAVFEGSVFKPVLEGVREKIVWDARAAEARAAGRPDAPPTDPEQDSRLAAAYEALIRIEAYAHSHAAGVTVDRWTARDYEKILEPMLLYLCPPDGKDTNLTATATSRAASDLSQIAERLYAGTIFGKAGADGLETRSWLKTPEDADAASEGTQALAKGLEAILGSGGVAENATVSEDAKKQLQEEKENALKLFNETEDQLAALTVATASSAKVQEFLINLKTHLDSLDAVRTKLGDVSKLAGMSRADLSLLCLSLQKSLDPLKNGRMPSNLAPIYAKATDILKSNPPPAKVDDSGEPKEKAAEPKKALSPEEGARLRYDTYQKRLVQATKIKIGANTLDVVGRLEVEITDVLQKAEAARVAAKVDYDGPRKEQCLAAAAAVDLCIGEITVSNLLDAYLTRLQFFLGERLKFPLVKSDRRRYTAAEFKPAVDSFAKVVKDKTYFDNAPAVVRSCAGAQKLARVLEAFNDVMTIARVLNPDNATQPAGDGLYVQRSVVKPTVKKPDPNVPQFSPGIDPITRQPLPPTPAPEVETGVITAVVNQAGIDLIGGPGQAQKVKIHPNKALTFDVEVRVAGSFKPDHLTQTVPKKLTTDPWGVIQWMIDTPNQSLNILGVGFKLEASPTFPTTWPSRAMFGLPD